MKHFYLAVLLTCYLSITATAQDTIPTHGVDGQYITEWLLLAPFFPDNLSTDFLAEAVSGYKRLSLEFD